MSKYIPKNREKLLWELISKVRSNVDINRLKKIAVRGLSEVFKPDRCTIIQYDENQHTLPIDKYSEYLSSKNEKSMVGINLDDEYDFGNMTHMLCDMNAMQKKHVIHIPDAAKFIGASNLSGTKLEKYCTHSDFTTCVGISVFEENKIKMFFTVKFKKQRNLSEEDVEFIKIYAEQIYIAIKQNQISSRFKESLEKEKLLRKIVNLIRNTFEIKKMTKTFVFEVGKHIGASRAFFSKYDVQNKVFSTPEGYAEYLISPRMGSYSDFGRDLGKAYPFFSETLITTQKDVIVPDSEELIKKYNLEGTNDAINLRKYHVGGTIVVPVLYKNTLLGGYVFDFETPNSFTLDDIEFVRAVSSQTAAALYQAELFEQNKRRSEREKILREIISLIRKNLDVDKIIKTFIFEMGRYLNANKIFFSKYDAQTDSCLTPKKDFEFILSENIVRYETLGNILDKDFPMFCERIKAEKKYFLLSKVEEFFKTQPIDEKIKKNLESIKKFNFNSAIAFPIVLGDKLFGFYGFEYENETNFSPEDVDFIKTVSEQTAVAIYQAEVLHKAKKQAKNEALLRKIITRAAATLDMTDIKKMVRDIGKLLKADRCYFVEVDVDNMIGFPVDINGEYLSGADIQSIVEYEFPVEDVGEFVSFYLSEEDVLVFDYEKIKEENMPPFKGVMAYADKANLKSGVGMPFFYMNKLFAVLCIEYVHKKVLPSSLELDFLRFMGKQVGIAFKQIKLYQETKQTAEKEKLLRNIISVISSTLDIKKIEKYMTEQIGAILGLDRCFIVEYDKDLNSFKKVSKSSEYLAASSVKSITGHDFSKRDFELFKRFPEFFDTETAVSNLEVKYSENMEKYFEQYCVKSGFQLNIFYGETLFGVLVGHSSDKNKYFSEQDKDLIRILAKQAGIALHQSHLYEQEKATAEREKLLRDIITTTRSTFNIWQIKKTIVNETLKTVNADMVSIFEYYQDTNRWEVLDEYSEALSSPNRFRFKGLDVNFPPYKFFADIFRSKNEIIFSDIEEFVQLNKLQGTEEESLLYQMQAKSAISIPVLYRDELLGVLIITFEERHQFKVEQVDFIKSLSEQIGIALYQSRLFDKEKRARKKEKLLNHIVSVIRKSLDLNEMKKAIVDQVAIYLGAERVVIHQLNLRTNKYYVIDEYSEYRVSSDIKSYVGIDLETPELEFFKKIFGMGQEMIAPDFLEYLDNLSEIDEYTKEWIKNLGIKSDYAFPIKYQDIQLASLYITYDKNQTVLSKEEIEDIRYLSVQIGLALNQALTYQDLQSKIDQELLLRKVTEAIRGSLDIQEIKQKIVEELGKTLGADRCYLRSFDIEDDMFLAPDVEYLGSEDIQSLKNVEPDQEGLRYFFDQVKTQDGIYPVEVTDNFIIEHQAQNKALDRYFKQANIKSDFAMPVWSKKGELTFLVLHYIHESFYLTEEVRQLLIMLSRQISLALEQSDLYSELKTQAERESASRKVVEIIRSSLELNTILKSVGEELLGLFDVQRIFAGKIDFTKRENFVEVTIRDEIKGFVVRDEATFDLVARYWEDYLTQNRKNKIIDDMAASDIPQPVKDIYIELGVKSLLCLPIKAQDEIWGGIFLSSIDNYKKWTKDEVTFLEGIITQLDTAIRQAELYEFQKRTANKESILRSLISEIKLTRDLNQAYNKLLEKLAEVFNLNRVLFLESSVIVPEELNTKYEYVLDRDDLSVNNLIFPPVCMEKFFNLIRHFKTLTINDVMLCHPKSTLSFFEKYKIRAMMAVPLVKYNKEVKVLGFVVLCSEEKRIWTSEEVDLINAISESVVSVIWEISKFIEIEDLRNSFVLTLAHDFQVPLIGEKLAIEFLLEKSRSEGDASKELLEEILENNNNIITLLNKSVDIYNYDAGKKILSFDVYEISEVLHNAVYLQKNTIKKSVEIDFFTLPKSIFVKIDKHEIIKVLDTVLENAVEHTPEGESVKVRYFAQSKRVIISIHNPGAAIPEETQEIIFKRYEMALAIERKIGAGTGLFLAKKIVEAHKGSIWFETSNEKGTTFYISLPQLQIKHV